MLAKDLYANEGHFFNELIQNCDDNKVGSIYRRL